MISNSNKFRSSKYILLYIHNNDGVKVIDIPNMFIDRSSNPCVISARGGEKFEDYLGT